ncbi:MAG: type II toxin-antitoxin system HicA family toxin [Terriglobales bacterium]
MKRTELIRHIEKHGCKFVREGGNHTIYINPRTNRRSTIPRHREVEEFTARAICRQLEIPSPR